MIVYYLKKNGKYLSCFQNGMKKALFDSPTPETLRRYYFTCKEIANSMAERFGAEIIETELVEGRTHDNTH